MLHDFIQHHVKILKLYGVIKQVGTMKLGYTCDYHICTIRELICLIGVAKSKRDGPLSNLKLTVA